MAEVRPKTLLIHQLLGDDDLCVVKGDHFSANWLYDTALLPVSKSEWEGRNHGAKALIKELFSSSHAPVQGELLAFTGFSGGRSKFCFNTLITPSTTSVARETELPIDKIFDNNFYFSIDYKPDLATSIVGADVLPFPPGFSGSAVWNTRFVECRIAGEVWAPERAQITGILWGWSSSHACVVATRAGTHSRFFGLHD